jgi:hypothetical protein
MRARKSPNFRSISKNLRSMAEPMSSALMRSSNSVRVKSDKFRAPASLQADFKLSYSAYVKRKITMRFR